MIIECSCCGNWLEVPREERDPIEAVKLVTICPDCNLGEDVFYQGEKYTYYDSVGNIITGDSHVK